MAFEAFWTTGMSAGLSLTHSLSSGSLWLFAMNHEPRVVADGGGRLA